MSPVQSPTNAYTAEQAAERVHRSTRTVRQWIADGDLAVTVIRTPDGRSVRYSIDEADLLTALRSKQR